MRHYAITAGTSHYAHTFELPSVAQDLADVGTALESLGYSLAFTLTDPRTEELRRALDTWVGSDVRGDDALILYYTGHGERDSTRHYLLCADTVPGRLAGTALATEDVIRILTEEGVRRLLLIVDTCYSGQGAVDALGLLNLRKDYDGLLAFAVIAASRSRETASEGAFAQAFKEVLASPDLAGQRQRHLYLKQVVDGVNEELRRRSIPQHATYGVLLDEGGFDFIPNPRYQEDLPSEGVDLAVQRTWVSVEGRRRREELASHFQPRAFGTVDAESDGQDYFSGRVAVLARLASGTGSVIVTGSAGVGKSAVMGRLVVTTSLVDVAIHARHKVLDDIVSGIAAAIGSDAVTPEDLLSMLTDRSISIVIDALDEAGSAGSGEPTTIARFLRDLARLPQVRLLVGTRPHMVTTLGDGFEQINLDDPQWVTHEDLVAYAQKLLTAPHGPGSTSAYSPDSALAVAERIATRTYPNYLQTRLAARAFASRTDLPELPVGDTGQVFRWALAEQFGPADARARALLTPLAFAEGAGLPWGTIWPAIATAISGTEVSIKDVEWLLRSDAQEHVVEVTDAHGRSVYRLYHEAFADQLRADAPPNTQSRIVDALVTDDWSTADPYVRAHLPTHAAAAGRLAELAADPGFLLAVDRASLVRTLPSTVSRNANAYLHAVVQLEDDLTPGERASVLGMSAYRAGATDLISALESWPMPWRVRWSSVEETYQGRRIGLHDADVTAVAAGEVDGVQVLATADRKGEIRLWDVETGERVGATHRMDAGSIERLYVLATPTGPAVVGVNDTGVVHGWYPHTGQSVHLDTDDWGAAVACQVVDGRVVVATTTPRVRIRLWDLVSGAVLMSRRAWWTRRVDTIRFVTVAGTPALLIAAEVLLGDIATVARVSLVSLKGKRITSHWLRDGNVLDALDLNGQPTLVTYLGWDQSPRGSRWPFAQIRVKQDFDTWTYQRNVVELPQDPNQTLAICASPSVVLWEPRSRAGAGKVTFSESDGTTRALVSFRTSTGTWLARPAGRSVQAIDVAEASDDVSVPDSDRRTLAVSDNRVYVSLGGVRVWKSLECLDLATGHQAHQYPARERVERLFGGGAAPVFVSRKLENQFAVYELVFPDQPWRFDPDRIWFYQRPKGMSYPEYSVAVEGAETVVAAFGGSELVYWRLSDGDVRYRKLPVDGGIAHIALVGGKILLFVESFGDGVVLVDVESGDVVWKTSTRNAWTATVHTGWVDGRAVGITGIDSIILLDLLTGENLGEPLVGHTTIPVAYDSMTYNNRPLLVSGGLDRTVRVWDLRTHTQLAAIDVGADVTSVKFVPTCYAVIVATNTNVFRIELDQI